MSEEKMFRIKIFVGVIAALIGIAIVSNALDSSRDLYTVNKVKTDYDISFDHEDQDKYSGDVVSQQRDLEGFNRIEIRAAVELRVRQGDFSVAVETNEQFQEHILTRVEDGTLVVEFADRDGFKRYNIDELLLEISMPSFNGLFVSGAVDGRIRDINSDEVDIFIGGAANLVLDGECGNVKMVVEGAGNVDAAKLHCMDVVVTVDGAGHAEVFASDSVVATVNGLGAIEVAGDPKSVSKSVSGLGSIDVR